MAERVALFQSGEFTLSSGEYSPWKIECDVLTAGDWNTLGLMAMLRWPLTFSSVVGVPTGGDRFADEMRLYAESRGPVLVVDDVLTTGASIRSVMDRYPGSTGLVAFARGPIPDDVLAVWRLG